MKKTALSVVLSVLVLSVVSPAFAFTLEPSSTDVVTFNINGFSQSGDPTFFAGGETWGVLRFASIDDGLFNELWTEGKDGESILGFFWGLTDDPSTAGGDINQVGGHFEFYLYNDGTRLSHVLNNPFTRRSSVSEYDGITDGGTLFLSGDFLPGVNPLEDFTIEQDFNFASGFGTGEGFGNVTGGLAEHLFNNRAENNNQGGKNDLRFSFTVNTDTVPNGLDWFATINDPVSTHVVPEPTSMLLFGTGLAGAALRRRFRA